MSDPTSAERRTIRDIFHKELLLHVDRNLKDCYAFIEKYYADDYMGIHAHHRSHPITNRLKDHQDPVETVKEFHDSMFKAYWFCPKMYHSLIWLDVNHQTSTSEKCAVAAIHYEGYQVRTQFGRRRTSGGQQFEPDYNHITVYVLRHTAPFTNRNWKIHCSIAGLPSTGHAARIDPSNFPAWDKRKKKTPRGVHKIGEMPDARKHDIAFYDQTGRMGAQPALYFGWDVVFNRLG